MNIRTRNVIQIGGDMYPLKKRSLQRLLKELRGIGYTIKDCRKDEYRAKRGISAEKMEEAGWYLWYASLNDIRFCKCEFCESYISTCGTRQHGHRCEECGNVVYWHVVDGSMVTFRFLDTEKYSRTGYELFGPELKMKAKQWDAENGYLYLYPEPLEGGFRVVIGDQAQAYLESHSEKWEMHDGLIKIKDPLEFCRDTAVIEHCDIYGCESHVRIVKLWDGKEYKEYEKLPIPESMCIYEPWYWAPLGPSPKLHERLISSVHMVSDQGYYYQDGRPAFNQYHFGEMAKFVDHFTTLSGQAFRLSSDRWRRDGPGAIEDLARFCCGDKAKIVNEPNIGNVLVAMSKAASGQFITKQEVNAAACGMKDPHTVEFLSGLGTRARRKNRPE